MMTCYIQNVTLVPLNVNLVLIMLKVVTLVTKAESRQLQIVHVSKVKLKLLENVNYVTGTVESVPIHKDIVKLVLKIELNHQPVFVKMVLMKSINKPFAQFVILNVPNVKIMLITV